MFPFVLAPAKVAIRRYLNIDEGTVANALRLVDEELDFVAELLSDGRRYLAGDRFSAADLAFAALCAPLIVPVDYGTPLPQPEDMPDEMATRVEAWRAHPAGRFATRMFAEQRRATRRSRLRTAAAPTSATTTAATASTTASTTATRVDGRCARCCWRSATSSMR